MLKCLLATLLLILPPTLAAQTARPAPATPATPPPQVVLRTSQGDITLELYPDKAPKSVANFLQYVRDGFYDGTLLHRAIPGYLVQGGLYTRDLQPKRTRSAVASEADNGLSNLRGTVAVARGADPNSGTAQFFFNLVDNRRLDFVGNQSGLTWGYTVFGKVIKGMEVVDKIAALPTRPLGPFAGDVPNPLVLIEAAHVVGEEAPAPAASAAAPATAASATTKPAARPDRKAAKPAGKG
ncbi:MULTISPECIES: peptidylprolyl isomerase [Rhodanobacter]|uniref:Peptidyl-prolyl cis-trans isomerase n=1 Tax=Rhodanobacter denitrificans TaxID=666685 RepID=M4NPZ3_9GAMM|nr:MULTISPECIES: peptidylprolyl isomerase [Rhodanobacter]AGG89696.1 peptidyl-prolyl cis-trans isomerase (rotamase) - cyclophilin family [Rhodanobacter denitrificans]UJM85096.1 peptidylprolyl isomerase [Rhodanobacter denitrificans]UJM95640.1 peptidylprolyl isomerase [Rhodanobacter denitrificans]UJM99168.1 peptidylprolyl isomerase [Rhodanobacter denitrificans]UJN23397.1 peptidylprolyl isomerase [Rhodanobacter denitrificans]